MYLCNVKEQLNNLLMPLRAAKLQSLLQLVVIKSQIL